MPERLGLGLVDTIFHGIERDINGAANSWVDSVEDFVSVLDTAVGYAEGVVGYEAVIGLEYESYVTDYDL
ncbi:hypothetical protein DSL72_002053 [Monilinia vaccinii-corymbosi]|uniref:Uncharacterized protein n=1 Tax=Monilinia vaccinii-corymbosi TaxID=61207 RepID=A0A8A3PBL0_9HELO|nr:hypothetical protein DSL72_002053 [Monilinia vaccinii-corymbosi]